MKERKLGQQFYIFENANYSSQTLLADGAPLKINKAQATERIVGTPGQIFDIEVDWQLKSVQYKSEFITPYDPGLGVETDDFTPERLFEWRKKLLRPRGIDFENLGFLNIYIRDLGIRQFGVRNQGVILPKVRLRFLDTLELEGSVMNNNPIHGNYRRIGGYKPLGSDGTILKEFRDVEGFEVSLPFDEGYLSKIQARFAF